jgi:hypothetical protein
MDLETRRHPENALGSYVLSMRVDHRTLTGLDLDQPSVRRDGGWLRCG